MKRYSIIQDEKKCAVCGTTQNIHTHEVFFGINRKKSIEDGGCMYLCGKHHNLSDDGVHFNHDLDIKLKQIAEWTWIEHYGKTEDDFIERYGKNYL